MDKLSFQGGGFPMSVERLDSMQTCWAQIASALGAVVSGSADKSDYIVAGCLNDRGDAFDGTREGWVVLGGELLPFRAGGAGGYVAVQEATAESVTYQGGESKAYRTSRYATLSATPNGHPVSAFQPASKRSLADIFALAARQAELTKALDRIQKLETQLAALDSSTGADISALQRQLVPKGTVIAWPFALPFTATTKQAVAQGMGAAVGYVPLVNNVACSVATANAWNGYFEDIGLPAAARFAANTTTLNFVAGILARIFPDFYSFNTEGRFLLSAGTYNGKTYALGQKGGQDRVALTQSEMPKHSHYVRGKAESVKHDGYKNFLLPEQNTTQGMQTRATTEAGGSQSHENMPPYVVVNYLIKAI